MILIESTDLRVIVVERTNVTCSNGNHWKYIMHISMLRGDEMERQLQGNGYTVGFSNKEVTAWGGIALMKQMKPWC